jgi:hypothetical protein
MQGGDIPPIANMILISILTVELSILVYSIVAMFQKDKAGLPLWGRWTIVTFLGCLAVEFLNTFILILNAIDYTLLALVTGTVVGFAQWFILRSRMDHAEYWILATAIGCLAAFSITEYDLEFLSGLFLGVIQALVLGPQYRGSAWWILASTAGIAYWMWISPITTWPSLLIIITIGLSPIVYAALTGIVIVWLMNRRDQVKTEVNIVRG